MDDLIVGDFVLSLAITAKPVKGRSEFSFVETDQPSIINAKSTAAGELLSARHKRRSCHRPLQHLAPPEKVRVNVVASPRHHPFQVRIVCRIKRDAVIGAVRLWRDMHLYPCGYVWIVMATCD